MRTAVLATAVSALALSFAVTAPASATTTYDVVSGFTGNANDGSSVWTYGWEVGPSFSSFVLFDHHNTNCITSGLTCWQSPDPQLFVPLVAQNTTNGTLVYAYSVVHPTDVLNLHPGGSQDGSATAGNDINTVVRFTAPSGGEYHFAGFFEALDTNPTGVQILAGGTPVAIGGHAVISSLTVGAPTDFAFNRNLFGGQTVDFVVNRAGNYYNDSTGLALTVSVPEPATWGLMIIGFGGMGAVLRANRRRAVAATA
jgi:hypothetical protein